LANKNVLVVGGGIAGVASSLKLASNGFKVYLVEREPAIGGQALFFVARQPRHVASVRFV
jgi:heterodisulfide reductase subunit A